MRLVFSQSPHRLVREAPCLPNWRSSKLTLVEYRWSAVRACRGDWLASRLSSRLLLCFRQMCSFDRHVCRPAPQLVLPPPPSAAFVFFKAITASTASLGSLRSRSLWRGSEDGQKARWPNPNSAAHQAPPPKPCLFGRRQNGRIKRVCEGMLLALNCAIKRSNSTRSCGMLIDQ